MHVKREAINLAAAAIPPLRDVPDSRCRVRWLLDVADTDPAGGHAGHPAQEAVAIDRRRGHGAVALARHDLYMGEMGYGILLVANNVDFCFNIIKCRNTSEIINKCESR